MACKLRKKAYDAYKKFGTGSQADAKAFADDFVNLYEYSDGRLQIKHKAPEVETNMSDPISTGLHNMNIYASNLLAGSILPAALKVGSPVAEQIHEWAAENVPLYDNTTKWVGHTWKNEKIFKQLRTFVKPELMGNYEELNKLASIYQMAKQDNINRMDEITKELENKLEKAYSPEQIAKLDDILAKSGLFNLTHDDILYRLANGESTLDEEINKIEKNFGPGLIKDAENLADVYLGIEVKDANISHNNSEKNLFLNTQSNLDALVALKVLNKVEGSVDLLQDLHNNNNELYTKLVGLAISTKQLMDEVVKYNGDTFKERGNLIDDIPSVDYEIKAVTDDMLKTNTYVEEEGWKILRTPEAGKKIGLVYRENLQTIQDGVGVNISYIKNGIPLYSIEKTKEAENGKDNAFVMSGNKKVLYLTAEEKKLLKYENNPVKSIMRSYAHKELIRETQAIRDTFLESMTKDYSQTELAVIDKELKESIGKNEHPVFLQLPKNMSLTKAVKEGLISKEVAAEYEAVDKTMLSDIAGFKDKVGYIRKDVGYYVLGYKDSLPFTTYNANLMLSRTKDLIRWAKTNLIIVNPIKITFDFTAGMSLAASKGATIQEAWKYSKEAVRLSKEMSDLRNKRILLKTEYRMAAETEHTRKNSIKNKLDKLEKQIQEHEFSGALANGFINSLATEMLSKERDSQKGLQVNIDRVLDKLTKDESGEYTRFNGLVKRFAKAGVNIEVIYEGIGNMLEDTKYGKNVSEILKSVSNDMEKAKNKDDMKDYLSQFVLSPNSHFVRLGSAATLYADLIPRWIIYRHNLNIGMTDAEAATDALNSLLDYKMNLPPSLKFMSDLYFMPFPTFFVRIQRVILNLLEKSPASFAANYLSMEIAGAHGQTILQSNIFNKWDNDTIFTNTFDVLRPSNMIPFSNAVPFF